MSQTADFIEFHESENNSFTIKHKSLNKYIKVGRREAEFLKLMLSQPQESERERLYAGELTAPERRYLAAKFEEWGFLQAEAAEVSGKKKDMTLIKLLRINPDAWLERRLGLIRVLLHPVAIGAYTLLMLGALYMMMSDPGLINRLSLSGLGVKEALILYLMMVATTAFHEMSHAAVCKKYGGSVPETGVMLFYFGPAMFCDVSSTYLFKKKRHKLAVLFAGIYSQWMMTAISAAAFYGLLHAGIEVPLLFYYSVANLGMSLLNLIPLVKLDGYWMLSHSLGIVNLRQKAFRYIFGWLLPGKETNRKPARPFETGVLLLYGIAAAAFTPLFWGWGIYQLIDRLQPYIGIASYAVALVLLAMLAAHAMKFWKTLREPV
ncbi:daptide biosynthesis intramembrane metalloprotease [Saccharibacillus sacchari]|uniref:daptide biosynthesis intramembrane metalloprotease n=1 Tax=Saccharibacillus sacchari TaxID=456493 RepID=UPI0004AF0AED|nr:daptide biosynthesis intramembrane metalloprotease [Saccharibacillus sacchari]